jgi:ribosomal protein L33
VVVEARSDEAPNLRKDYWTSKNYAADEGKLKIKKNPSW